MKSIESVGPTSASAEHMAEILRNCYGDIGTEAAQLQWEHLQFP